MGKNTQIKKAIKQAIKEAPSGWAREMAEERGVTIQAVYAWARCERGVKDGKPEEVLSFLLNKIKTREKMRQKLIARKP